MHKYSLKLIQSCLNSRVIITGIHFHHDIFAFDFCSELSNYKKINFGMEILPTSFKNADKRQRRELYDYVKVNYWFGGSATLYHIEELPEKVKVFGLERLPYPKSRGLITDFKSCREYYTRDIKKDDLLIEEIKRQDIDVVLIGKDHQKTIYSAFPNCEVINQTCNFLDQLTPSKIEIENSFVIADSCELPVYNTG